MLLYDACGLETGGDCRLRRAMMTGAVNFQFADDDLNAFLRRLQAMDRLHAGHGFSEKESLRIAELAMTIPGP